MDLLGKARDAFAQVTAEVAKGTEYLSLQTQLGNLSAELDKQLIEVGKRARELAQQGQLADATMQVFLERCDALEAQIMELRAKAQEAKEAPEIPAPPAPAAPPPPSPAPPQAPTVPTVVTPPVAPPPAPAANKCAACSAELATDAKFCGECGAKVGA